MKLLGLALIMSSGLLCTKAFSNSNLKSVYVEEVKKKELFDSFNYPAKIVPVVHAGVLSESQGVVGKIHKNLGQKVKKGQILATIRHTDPVYNYKDMMLRSPVTGVVSKIFIHEGSYVGKGKRLFTVTDPKRAKVEIEVPAKDRKHMTVGLKGELKSLATSEIYEVELVGISPYLDPATGTATAELRLLSKEKSVPLGALGKVSFKSNVRKGFMLPQDTIVYRGRDTFVKVVSKEDKVKRVDVKIGEKRRGDVEILKGIKEGDFIVKRSSGFLKEGAKVEVKNRPENKEGKTEKGQEKS